jgi:hypothetical protein
VREALSVGLLVFLTAGALLADRVAPDLAIPAATIFGLAGTGLVAYAVKQLKIGPDVKELLRLWAAVRDHPGGQPGSSNEVLGSGALPQIAEDQPPPY